jgi:hypothetical protein
MIKLGKFLILCGILGIAGFASSAFAITISKSPVTIGESFNITCDNIDNSLYVIVAGEIAENEREGNIEMASGSEVFCNDLPSAFPDESILHYNNGYHWESFLQYSFHICYYLGREFCPFPLYVAFIEKTSADCDSDGTYQDCIDLPSTQSYFIQQINSTSSVVHFLSISGGLASSSDLLASTGALFVDLWVIIALAISIPLGLYILDKIIGVPAEMK